MKVSVIVCTYSPTMLEHCLECIDSLLNQTYKNLEVICIVDGNKEYYNMLKSRLNSGESNKIKLYVNKRNEGLLRSRNKGSRLAKGDIVAFIDDDAIADRKWVEELVRIYREYDALAVGGKMAPLWLVKKPKWFPEEFYWLVGVTYPAFPEKICEVRNTFGSNLSFRRDVFLELGGFNIAMGGIKGKKMLQGGETDLCMRMYKSYGRKVIYNPNAVVYHKIFKKRTQVDFLIKRCFWQGYSKAVMKKLGGNTEEEASFLKQLIFKDIPERFLKCIKGKDIASNLSKIIAAVGFTAIIGFGYCYGYISKGGQTINEGK